MEIEYEGPNFVQEYRAALEYLNIADGVQTRLGDTENEFMPKHMQMKPQKALPSSPPPPAAAPVLTLESMGIHLDKPKPAEEESEPAHSEYDLENPGLGSMQSSSEESAMESHPDGGLDSSESLLFRALERASRGSSRETSTREPVEEERKPEPKVEESKPLFEDKPPQTEGAVPSSNTRPLFEDKPPQTEGAVPPDKLSDDRFKGILKRLGLAT